jgi:RNA ligase
MESKKYNRTFHLPWSPGATDDDKIAIDVSALLNVPIVITEKMDGSNTSLEHDGCFARTHAGPPVHASFNGLKSLHASVKYIIEPGTQIFGEWCYALHSIAYSELPSYFMIFGVRHLNESGVKHQWGSWDDVNMWAKDLGISTVPELYTGIISSEKELKELTNSFMNQPSVCGGIREGVVVRVASSFEDEVFSQSVLKCVRANHVQTSEHWKDQEIIKNKLILK